MKFGYYFGDPLYMVEQENHVNLWWATVTGGTWHLGIAEQLQQARGAGIKNVVLQLNTTDIAELRFQFGKLSEGGYFAGWDSLTLYPLDEPGKLGYSDAQVSEIVLRIRQLGLDIPGLLGLKVGVFYGCTDPKPGIASYDFVGCFRYGGDGCGSLESDYANLRRASPKARLWVIPGGAHINGKEGRQDPACWASYAHRNADVWGVVPFMWQGGADPNNHIVGIREQADMRRLYCETGRVILGREPRC